MRLSGKGFDVILALLQDADKRDLPIEFVLVGRSVDDDLLMRSGRIFVTGEYKEEEAISMVREQKADLAFSRQFVRKPGVIH